MLRRCCFESGTILLRSSPSILAQIDLGFLFRRAIDQPEVASKLSLFFVGQSVSFGINGLGEALQPLVLHR